MMQEDLQKTTISKPVPTRVFSNYRPVQSLDPLNIIKPKTVRLKPKLQNEIPPLDISTSKDELSESFGEDLNASVLYKPTPKHVLRRNASLFANMENMPPNKPSSSSQTLISDPSTHYSTRPVTTHYPNPTSHLSDPSCYMQNTEQQTQEMSQQTANSGSSYDGYNWRKYGQKQVKGSEFPRSYYKCTHPTCPVKKKVERTLEGQIAEIVYKGEHNHSKPQPPKRPQPSINSEGNISSINNNSNSNNNNVFDENIFETRIESHSEFGLPFFSSYYQGQDGNFTTHSEIGRITTSGNIDRPMNKRRKKDDQISGGNSIPGFEDPGNGIPTTKETDAIGDGFHWRKYGQKVVKGNPYPRSYYRCTSPKCNVRKYVERASDNSGSYVTTYEGKHNHEAPPSRGTNSRIS